jgi:hypothetical protein
MLCSANAYFTDSIDHPTGSVELDGGPNGDMPVINENKTGLGDNCCCHATDHSTAGYNPGAPGAGTTGAGTTEGGNPTGTPGSTTTTGTAGTTGTTGSTVTNDGAGNIIDHTSTADTNSIDNAGMGVYEHIGVAVNLPVGATFLVRRVALQLSSDVLSGIHPETHRISDACFGGGDSIGLDKVPTGSTSTGSTPTGSTSTGTTTPIQ